MRLLHRVLAALSVATAVKLFFSPCVLVFKIRYRLPDGSSLKSGRPGGEMSFMMLFAFLNCAAPPVWGEGSEHEQCVSV